MGRWAFLRAFHGVCCLYVCLNVSVHVNYTYTHFNQHPPVSAWAACRWAGTGHLTLSSTALSLAL